MPPPPTTCAASGASTTAPSAIAPWAGYCLGAFHEILHKWHPLALCKISIIQPEHSAILARNNKLIFIGAHAKSNIQYIVYFHNLIYFIEPKNRKRRSVSNNNNGFTTRTRYSPKHYCHKERRGTLQIGSRYQRCNRVYKHCKANDNQ